MPKVKISEFDIDPANNTDINNINIAEGCAPSGINNAIRQLMSDLKEFQTGAGGDPFNGAVNGTVGATTPATGAFTTLSASSTVSGTGFSTYLASPPAIGGTAAAAGNFTTLGASSTATLNTLSSSGATITGGSINGTTVGASTASTGAFTSLSASGAFSANGGTTLGDASGDALTINSSAVSIPNGLNFDSNTLVIDATNNRVGVGIASPTQTFDVQSSSGGTTTRFRNTAGNFVDFFETSGLTRQGYVGTTDGTNWSVHNDKNGYMAFDTNNAERMRINSAGDVGIGTSSPTTKLDVNGTATAKGAIIANGANGQVQFGSTSTYNIVGGVDNGGFRYNLPTGLDHQFRINGSDVMRLTSAGNVGIGTSSPSDKLDIFGGKIRHTLAGGGVQLVLGNSLNAVSLGSIESGGDASLGFYTNTSTERMRLDSSGNLGLGVTPSAWVNSVRAIEMKTGALWSYNSGTLSSFYIMANSFLNSSGNLQYKESAAASQYVLQAGGHLWYTAPSGTAGNAITFTQAMTLDASGNLGIGTTTQNERIRVNSSSDSQARITVAYADTPISYFGSYRGIVGSGNATDVILTSANTLAFGAGSHAERMRIDSSGNLLVNRTSRLNNGKIEVLASTSEQAVVAQVQSNGNSLFQGFNATGTAVFVTTGNGYLSATGTINFPSVYSTTSASAANVFVDSAGDLFRSTSSLKYKTDVQDTVHGLAEVMQLRSVTYKGKSEADGDKVFGGLIAEEVHEAGLTEFVQYADDGTPDALAYGNMVSLAFKAIQEQQSIINDLKARIETLETK
jgi:hypothetical protein